MGVRVSRILHAGYVFESEGVKIAFDPIFENPFSRNCYAFPQVQFDHQKIANENFGAVFISHYHDDHCSFDSLKLLNRDTPIYLYCVYEELFDWIRELGFKNVYALELGMPVNIGPFDIITRQALDADVDSLFHIKVDDLNILNVVDSWIGPSTLSQLARTADWDLFLWPFQTMREMEVLSPSRSENSPVEIPHEWIDQLKILKPRFLIPSSCQFQMEKGSWYNRAFFPISYSEFGKVMESEIPTTDVFKLNPGQSIRLEKGRVMPAAALDWIIPIGEANVDYVFDPKAPIPSTSDIAKTLEPLPSQDAQCVYDYCQGELLQKVGALSDSAHQYFDKPRIWRLSVFGNKGVAKVFHYEIKNDVMRELTANSVPPDRLSWTTDIPEATLFGALFRGESLTSLYIRVNDMKFDDETEGELVEVDPIEDPLIRSLYHGAFGSYQLAQLKRIKGI